MPNKHNAARRHHIPKMQLRVTNWPAYEAGLRNRGSLTFWVTPEALAGFVNLMETGRGFAIPVGFLINLRRRFVHLPSHTKHADAL